MKNIKIFSAVLTFTLIISCFCACGIFKNQSGESSVPASSIKEDSSSVNSQSIDNKGQNSTITVTSNEPEESQPGPVIQIETGNKNFDKLFKSNPIDKKYIEESNNAFSNIEMIEVSNKYAEIWEKEVTSAYNKLIKLAKGESLSKIKAEQENWTKEKENALKKISEEAAAAGGTMAQVNEASKVMDYYRSRAAEIYKQLYSYDNDFKYQYK